MYNYSKRLAWPLGSNAFGGLLERKRRAGKALLDLTVSNPTQALANYPHAELAQALGQTTDFTYYPDPFGSERAREAVVNWYRARGMLVRPDQVALTASTSESYSLIFKLLCDPGDDVLVPAPSYPLFEYLGLLDGVKMVPYQLRYDGSWFLDVQSLRGKVSARTRALVVVNPNNPTGSLLKQYEAQELSEVSTLYGIPIISDEVFMDYAFSDLPQRARSFIGKDHALSFSLNGLSKSAGMPQMKLGWIVINGAAAVRAEARNKLELLLDTYLSVNTPVQNALPDLFRIGQRVQLDIVERLRDNRRILEAALAGTAVHCLPVEAGWSAMVQVPNTRSEEQWILELLDRYETVVQPGYFFDMASEAYLVLSLLTQPDVFKEGISRLKSYWEEQCGGGCEC